MLYPIRILAKERDEIETEIERINEIVKKDGYQKTETRIVLIAFRKKVRDITVAINLINDVSVVNEKDHPPKEADLIKKKS